MENLLHIDDNLDGRNGENVNLCRNYISSEDPESSEPFPIEIVAEILKYLSPIQRIRLERVSKLWREASKKSWNGTKTLSFATGMALLLDSQKLEQTGNLRNIVELENEKMFVYTRDLKIRDSLLFRVGPYIRTLRPECSSNPIADGGILSIVAKYCHNIQVLDLKIDAKHYDESALSRLITVNEKLHKIEYMGTEFYIKPLLLRNWKSVHLGLQKTCNKDEEWVKNIIALINRSESLEEFSMSYHWTSDVMEALYECKHLKALSIRGITDSEVLLEVFKMKHLKSLMIRFNTFKYCGPGVNLAFLRGLSEHCQTLEKLDIKLNCNTIEGILTALSLPELMTLKVEVEHRDDFHFIRLGKLRNFALRSGGHFNDDGLITMIMNAEELQVLAIDCLKLKSSTIQKIRDELGKCSRAITLMVPNRLLKESLKICQNSTIHIKNTSEFIF